MTDAYFCWLVGLIQDEYIGQNYQKLLWKLYSTDYIWELDFDENRAADGLLLRKIYAQNCANYGNFGCDFNNNFVNFFAGTRVGMYQNLPCSMLEMMIALARRAEDDIMHEPDFGDRTGQWFWVMIQNLGLDVYDDYHYFESEVDRILYVFVHRLYDKNGIGGGAFPIRRMTRDLRQTDLWWQMNAYLEEQFPV